MRGDRSESTETLAQRATTSRNSRKGKNSVERGDVREKSDARPIACKAVGKHDISLPGHERSQSIALGLIDGPTPTSVLRLLLNDFASIDRSAQVINVIPVSDLFCSFRCRWARFQGSCCRCDLAGDVAHTHVQTVVAKTWRDGVGAARENLVSFTCSISADFFSLCFLCSSSADL